MAVNAVSMYPMFRKYPVHPTDLFYPGLVGVMKNSTVGIATAAGLANGTEIPVGIINDTRDGRGNDSIGNSGLITIIEDGVIDTDFWSLSYAIPGDPLYLSSSGSFLCDYSSGGPQIGVYLGGGSGGFIRVELTLNKISPVIPVQTGPTIQIIPGNQAAPATQKSPGILQSAFVYKSLNIKDFIEPIKKNGMKCCKCGEFNEYIDTPNQSDGTYKCYGCRN